MEDECTVVYSNVDSFMNKIEEFKTRISEMKPSIIGLTELKAKHQIYDPGKAEYEIPNYDLFLNRDPDRGVALYVHKELDPQEVPELDDKPFKECVWSSFRGAEGESVLLGVIYRSPASPMDNDECLFELLKSEEIKKNDKICVMGDLNFPNVHWDGTRNGFKNSQIIENFADAFLIQKVTNPNRHREGQRSTMDDLVFVNEDNLISDILHTAPVGKSDHEVLVFQLYVTRKKSRQEPKYKYNLSKGNYNKLRERVSMVDFSVMQNQGVEGMWL